MEPESNEGAQERAKAPVRHCVLIPTYDNARTVVEVVEGAMEVGLPVIVVLDGPTDGTAELVRAIEGITVLEHPENRGKGAALRTGFEHAVQEGFSHAVTLDSDGQHDPARVVDLVEAVRDALRYGLVDLARIERMTLRRVRGDFFRLPVPDDEEDDDG